MSDDGSRKQTSFVSGLKTEWALFWDNLIGDDEDDKSVEQEAQEARDKIARENSKDPFVTGKLESLSLEKIKMITKALSQDRKTLNQRLESLKKEMDLNSAKLESLHLVGGEKDETHRRLHELSDLGQALNEKLTLINERLRRARKVEDKIKAQMKKASPEQPSPA
jgi:hypothetical protein